MKFDSMKSPDQLRAVNAEGFTLLDLLVVLGVIAVLITLQLPVLAGGKSQSKIGLCASHVRQLALACQIYANDNGDKLPVLTAGGGAAWAWDLPNSTAATLLNSGTEKKTFYCPGTAPRFTDKENWNPSVTPHVIGDCLWDFNNIAAGGNVGFHIIGYALAFSGQSSVLSPTNQNTTIQIERITNQLLGSSYVVPISERVLVADATISANAALPGYANPGNNYVSIPGGFTENGVSVPHVSPHLKGLIPVGGNLGFKDGHVDWRKFELMTPRTTGGAVFWW